ncbi:MAG: hypothetical protein Q9226_009007, partial [Calogaya cf. arnoldii]
RAALVREELSTVEDPEDLRLIVEACAVGNQQWSDAASVALDASACGASNYHRIEDWMSAISDVRASTIADCATSEPSLGLHEASVEEFFSQSTPPAHLHGRLSPMIWNHTDSVFTDQAKTVPAPFRPASPMGNGNGKTPETQDAGTPILETPYYVPSTATPRSFFFPASDHQTKRDVTKASPANSTLDDTREATKEVTISGVALFMIVRAKIMFGFGWKITEHIANVHILIRIARNL